MKHAFRFFLLSFALLSLTADVKAYGEPTFAGSSTLPPSCSNSAPKMVWPFTAKAVGNNAIELKWGKMDNVSSWTVAYGYGSKKYIYGLSNFGNGNWNMLTINDLPAGTYYVAIRGNNGCMPGPFSLEWKVKVGSSTRLNPVGNSLGAYDVGVVNPPAVNPPVVNPKVYTSPATTKTVVPTVKTVKPSTVVPSPAPKKASWLQNVLNFFSGK